MWHDLIVDEIHRIRDEYAKQFDYDLHAICEDLRAQQARSERPPVDHPPRKPVAHRHAA